MKRKMTGIGVWGTLLGQMSNGTSIESTPHFKDTPQEKTPASKARWDISSSSVLQLQYWWALIRLPPPLPDINRSTLIYHMLFIHLLTYPLNNLVFSGRRKEIISSLTNTQKSTVNCFYHLSTHSIILCTILLLQLANLSRQLVQKH